MGCDEFRFKSFTVRQCGAAMKVGTDGVLLGAWCPVDRRMRTALDIGTGTGLLALMIAQRCAECRVDAVEIEESSFRQACANFASSPWSERITAYNSSIQDLVAAEVAGNKYDLVISNPPYFENSLQSPDRGRTTARHTSGLTYEELVRCAATSLAGDGIFAVIVPHIVTDRFCSLGEQAGLYLHRWTEVRPKAGVAPHRSLLAFRKTPPQGQVIATGITIEDGGRHQYSEEYIALTRDFYLKF